ncbi:hypothetical protein X975_25217, partial [Stegodyphus mimosarum]
MMKDNFELFSANPERTILVTIEEYFAFLSRSHLSQYPVSLFSSVFHFRAILSHIYGCNLQTAK